MTGSQILKFYTTLKQKQLGPTNKIIKLIHYIKCLILPSSPISIHTIHAFRLNTSARNCSYDILIHPFLLVSYALKELVRL